jgi:plasmid maintenance system antidote protein VapI
MGPSIPPGEILLEEYLKPLGLAQVEAARRLDISLNRRTPRFGCRGY